MGGEGFVIKLRPVSTLSVQDMGISANVDPDSERVWRWMKMACGENPKVRLTRLITIIDKIEIEW